MHPVRFYCNEETKMDAVEDFKWNRQPKDGIKEEWQRWPRFLKAPKMVEALSKFSRVTVLRNTKLYGMGLGVWQTKKDVSRRPRSIGSKLRRPMSDEVLFQKIPSGYNHFVWWNIYILMAYGKRYRYHFMWQTNFLHNEAFIIPFWVVLINTEWINRLRLNRANNLNWGSNQVDRPQRHEAT